MEKLNERFLYILGVGEEKPAPFLCKKEINKTHIFDQIESIKTIFKKQRQCFIIILQEKIFYLVNECYLCLSSSLYNFRLIYNIT